MELDFENFYKNLAIHQLERDEIEFELGIRGLPFTDTENRAALVRRLKEQWKREREGTILDLNFNRLNKTIDAEIVFLDARLRHIKDYLLNKRRYEGTRESLKTRLVHCYSRTKLLIECTENETDLTDIDKLQSVINELYNAHFSPYSPFSQQDVVQQINESLSNLMENHANIEEVDRQDRGSSGVEELISIEPMGGDPRSVVNPTASHENAASEQPVQCARRVLMSTHKIQNRNVLPNAGPYLMPSFMYPWMINFPPRQLQPQSPARGDGKIVDPNSNPPDNACSIEVGHDERRENRISRGNNNGNNVGARNHNVNRIDTDQSNDSSGEERRENIHRRVRSKSRPVSDWNLKYDGTDNGQNLMRFLREVEFYAKAENLSTAELFRAGIHLFKGPAKTWFMLGIENEDFNSWRELKEELKREFLSHDHDHQNEIRAIARKQGAREKFQDFFLEMQQIFNSLTKPLNEKKKFELVFRNLRPEYKGHVISAEIDNLADLKKFGRALDSTYAAKQLVVPNEIGTRNRQAQVNTVSTGAIPKENARNDERHNPRNDDTRTRYTRQNTESRYDPRKAILSNHSRNLAPRYDRQSEVTKYDRRNTDEQYNPRNSNFGYGSRKAEPQYYPRDNAREEDTRFSARKGNQPRQYQAGTSSRQHSRSFDPSSERPVGGLQLLVDTYQPPRLGVCLNCRLGTHDTADCRAPKHKYCEKCGFHNVDTENCPFCIKNRWETVTEGRQLEQP